GLFDDDTRIARAIGLREVLHDGAECGRRYGEVISRALRRTELPTQSLEGCGIVVIATDELQQPGKLFEGGRIETTMFVEAVFGPGLESIQAPAFPGYADNRDVERAALYHGLQRGKDFFVGEVSGGAEEHQRVGMSRALCHNKSGVVFFQMTAETK